MIDKKIFCYCPQKFMHFYALSNAHSTLIFFLQYFYLVFCLTVTLYSGLEVTLCYSRHSTNWLFDYFTLHYIHYAIRKTISQWRHEHRRPTAIPVADELYRGEVNECGQSEATEHHLMVCCGAGYSDNGHYHVLADISFQPAWPRDHHSLLI